MTSLDRASRDEEGKKWKFAVVEDALVTKWESHLLKKATKLQGSQNSGCESRESTTATSICKYLVKGELEDLGIHGVNSACWAVHKKSALVLDYFASKILLPSFISYDACLSSAKSWVGRVMSACKLWKDQNSLFSSDLAVLLIQLLENSVFINFYPEKYVISSV